ncbi:MAG: holo-ACP synthase [Clostridia bacterium]|nr:holo-ACP synthase [Clostridia bacterium]
MTTGTDIIEITRIKKAISSARFFQRVFTQRERQYISGKNNPSQTAAGIYCAKEAALKALGTGLSSGIAFNDIEVTHDSLGKPYITLNNKALEIFNQNSYSKIDISISHCDSFAVAFCVMI